MDPLHNTEERKDVLARFSQKMIDSGYTKEVRKEIICSGIRRYYRLRLQNIAKTRNLYRNQEEMSNSRKAKWKKGRAWFKPQRRGEKVREENDVREKRRIEDSRVYKGMKRRNLRDREQKRQSSSLFP